MIAWPRVLLLGLERSYASALVSPDFCGSGDNDESGWKKSQLVCSEVSAFGQGLVEAKLSQLI
jgi:hypothetical protein